MSEVIEAMEILAPTWAPYSVLNNSVSSGIFGNRSQINYLPNRIQIYVREQLGDGFSFFTTITLRKSELSLQSALMRNSEYVVINSTEMRKNLYRSFVKTSNEPTMKTTINHEGRILMRMHSFLTSQVQIRQAKQAPRVYKFIEKVYTLMTQIFISVFEKAKLLIDPALEKKICLLPNSLQRLDIMKNTCHFIYVKPTFMKCNGERGKNNVANLPLEYINETELQVSSLFDMKVQSDKSRENIKYSFYIELWEASLALQKVEDSSLYNNFNLVQIKGMYKASLRIPETKLNKTFEPDQTISEIELLEPEKIHWSKLYEGGFGSLYKADVKFHYITYNGKEKKFAHERPMEKSLIIKTDRKNGAKVSRIEVEKMILQVFKGKKTTYIPQYYESTQKLPNFGTYILSDFYPYRSLDHWFKNYADNTSIFTKISILMFMCYGLYYVHQHQVIHRDIKISNFVIDSKLNTKIIDFGQSYHESIENYLKSKGRDFKLGVTFPYSPPDIFTRSPEKMKKTSYDIFSLGLVMYEMLFGSSPFQNVSQPQLKRVYREEALNMDETAPGRCHSLIKQKIYLSYEMLSAYGPTEILSPVLNVIERCLDPRAENRPHLEWIIIIIRQTYNSLLDFYSL